MWEAALVAWKLVVGFWKAARDWFADLPNWLKSTIAIALVVALWTWWINDMAYDRGDAARAASDKAEMVLCQSNVTTLQTAIDVSNTETERAKAEAAAKALAAAEAAKKKAADTAAARAREAARGPGAAQMNAFFRETFP